MIKVANKYLCTKNLKYRTKELDWRTSRLCEINEWENPEFAHTAKEIMGNNTFPKHRKVWEFSATVLALKDLGLLNKDSVCISVAAGVERILFYLANKTNGVIATDIYGLGDFSNKEANKSFINNQKQFAPYSYTEENLIAANCNALNLKFPDNSFDFAFSMSSIEHFGGIKNANRALKEMSRVVKPGGYVIITTEFAINNYITDQVFKYKDFKKLIKDTNLSGKLDFSLSNESLKYLCDMLVDDLEQLPHINLKAFASIFTSAILILKKDGSSNIQTNKSKLWSIAKNLRNEVKLKKENKLVSVIKKKLLNLKIKRDLMLLKLENKCND